MNRPEFENIVEEIMIAEGGFVDHPNDPGGATKYGVSLRFLEQQYKDMSQRSLYLAIFPGYGPPDRDLVKNLSIEQAHEIFDYFFWRPLGLKHIPGVDIAREVADLAYNAGIRQASLVLQRAINAAIPAHSKYKPVSIDGVIGPKTKAALEHVLATAGDDKLLQEFENYRLSFYRIIVRRTPSLGVFLKGWTRRAKAEDTPDLPPELEGNTDD